MSGKCRTWWQVWWLLPAGARWPVAARCSCTVLFPLDFLVLLPLPSFAVPTSFPFFTCHLFSALTILISLASNDPWSNHKFSQPSYSALVAFTRPVRIVHFFTSTSNGWGPISACSFLWPLPTYKWSTYLLEPPPPTTTPPSQRATAAAAAAVPKAQRHSKNRRLQQRRSVTCVAPLPTQARVQYRHAHPAHAPQPTTTPLTTPQGTHQKRRVVPR
jgi:hypothetical protein